MYHYVILFVRSPSVSDEVRPVYPTRRLLTVTDAYDTFPDSSQEDLVIND